MKAEEHAPHVFDIQGRRLTYPTYFNAGSSAVAMFPVPAAAADALIGSSPFRAAQIWPGKALLTLACVHYADSDCGSYEEIGIGFIVRPLARSPRLPRVRTLLDLAGRGAANFVWRLPVTTPLACRAGIDMWGLPKTVEQIAYERRAEYASFALEMDGRAVLRLTMRAAGNRAQGPIVSPVYSVLRGLPHVSYLGQQYREVGVHLGGGASLELGNHPIADSLRSLKLPRRPLAASWMGRLRFEMSRPRPLF